MIYIKINFYNKDLATAAVYESCTVACKCIFSVLRLISKMTAEYILLDACITSTTAPHLFRTWFVYLLEPLLLPLSRKRLFRQYLSQIPERLILPAIKFTQVPRLNCWSYRSGDSGSLQIMVCVCACVCVSRTKVNKENAKKYSNFLTLVDIQLPVGADFIHYFG